MNNKNNIIIQYSKMNNNNDIPTIKMRMEAFYCNKRF